MRGLSHHGWILVLTAGVIASIGAYTWLRDTDAQSVRYEMAQRNQARIDAIHSIFQQQFDTAMAIGAFIKGEMGTHEYVEEDEARNFTRAILDTHPDKLIAISIIPPEASGETQTVKQSGTETLDPLLDLQRLRQITPGTMNIQPLQDKKRRRLMRISFGIASGVHGTGYAVSDWDTAATVGLATAAMPGTGIEIGLIKKGQFIRIYRHRSLPGTGEDTPWKSNFRLNGIHFEVRIHTAPAALRQLTSPDPAWVVLLLGLAFSLLLTYLAYNRTRYGEHLRHDVTERTKTLEESEEKYRTLVNTLPMGVIIHESGKIRFANPAIASMFGVKDPNSLLGENVLNFVSGKDRPNVVERMQHLKQGETVPPVDVRLLRSDGSEFWGEARGMPVDYEGKTAVQILIQDISERKHHEAEIARLSDAVKHVNDIVFQLDAKGRVKTVNQAGLRMFGLTEEKATGKPFASFVSPESLPMAQGMFAMKTNGEMVESRYELTFQDTSGHAHIMEVDTRAIIKDGLFSGVYGVARDVTDRKEAEARLEYLSYYDELTKLPNRRLFADRADQMIAIAMREKDNMALLYLDLDRFKFINDTLGHPCGDQVLREAAARLISTLRQSDTAARMGGDEFSVLLQDANANTAMHVASKIRRAIQRPFQLGEQEFSLDVSIGIAVFPDDGKNGEELLKHADVAMYQAKKNHVHLHYFSAGMEKRAARHLQMEQYLAEATDEKQLALYFQSQHVLAGKPEASPFPLHYQGKYRLDDGDIIGVEALIRWNHPKLGLVPPAEFIPLAEETGLIRPITHWALCEAGRQAVAWEKEGIRPNRIGVNLSAVQLMQHGLAKEIIGHIHATGAKPEWLEIEITETAAMRDPETAIGIMQELVDAGIAIAIDDFGTGYSSLAYLKRLPAEWLKIDIAFIRNLPDDAEDAAIVRAIIVMAHALGIQIIAEGVETKAQLEFLRSEGCDAAQGYLFSKPLPADEASAHIKRYLKR